MCIRYISFRTIRIAALNEESDEESESEKEEVTREALEEIALQQYAKNLELQKKGNLKDALKLLKDLLDTELLYEVEKPPEKDNISRPLLNLKYLCYRNVASLSSQLGDKEGAIEAYLEASELDDSDVTLWFRLGKISLQAEKFELASFAFQRGVDCNPKHWPCIDNLITILLGLGNYNDCIANIYDALVLDKNYFRGRIYRKHIFTNYPYILEYLSLLNPLYKWKHEDDEDLCNEKGEVLLKEAALISECYIDQIDKNKVVERLPILTLEKKIDKLSWFSLGESLTYQHKYMFDNAISHACIVQIALPEKNIDEPPPAEPMETDCTEPKPVIDSVAENGCVEEKSEVEKTDDPKANSENEKEEKNEQEPTPAPETSKIPNDAKDSKDSKKSTTRRRGSSLSFLEQWEWCNKRRSSRKKMVNKQDRNDETIYESLKRLLPQNLLPDDMKQESKPKEFKAEDSMDTMDIYRLFEEKEKKTSEVVYLNGNDSDEIKKYFGTEKEETDVEKFITKYMECQCDIITMIDEFVSILCKLWKSTWPEKLGEVYVKANNCSKQHFDPPMGLDNSDKQINKYIDINLVHLEITIGKLISNPEDSPKEQIEIEILDLMKFICCKYEGTYEEINDVIMRYLWIRCHAHLYENQTEFALDCLYQILFELNRMCDEGETYILHVPNFHNKLIISKNNTIDLVKSLERNKQLATVLNLYEAGKFEEVLPILQDSFKNCQIQANKQEWTEMGLDWAVHLVVLLETLWALENTEQCFTWAVLCLHEALKQFILYTPGTEDYEKWSLTIVKIIMTIEHVLKKEGSSYLDILSEKALSKLVQDIVQIIVHQLDDSNTAEDLPLNTTVPWILLHYILQREEDCGRGQRKSIDDDAADKEEVPASLMILFTAHNYLGKRSWCTNNDGYLLYFTLNAVIPRLRSPALSTAVEVVSQCLEQVVYCLFGHPSKKTKTRYLYDHNVIPNKLDWNLAQNTFELYRPYEMPGFNSYKLGSITSETEQLLQRMLSLMPSPCDPQSYVSEVIAYIENKKENLPDANISFPYKIRDIYYLLADYYLKNSETIKALKYYAYDIVITKNRFDSWAGIALARGSLLETKLNSCETFKSEMEYLNRAAAVERCFKKALDIDSSHSMLWIEYGAFVYGVHSFCSRMLKQASESLSMENFETLEKRKNDMLDTAHKCFIAAHEEWKIEYEIEDKSLQDERWLHYYMLGKIAEKKSEAPIVYLEHYLKASKYLLDNNATYPSKINYNNPQNLSVEALEIHYRIHASILKYIEQHENKAILVSVGKSFKDCLSKCSSGPFSKKKQMKEVQSEKEVSAVTETNNETAEPATEKNSTETPFEQQSEIKRTLEPTETEESPCKRIKLTEPEKVVEEPEKVQSENSSNENTFKGFDKKDLFSGDMMETACEVVIGSEKDSNEASGNLLEKGITDTSTSLQTVDQFQTNGDNEANYNEQVNKSITPSENMSEALNIQISGKSEELNVKPDLEKRNNEEEKVNGNENKIKTKEARRTSQESTTSNTVTSKEVSSSDSTSDSSTDDSSSDSSSDSSNDSNSDKTDAEKADNLEMSNEEICNIISMCLDNLEDCVSRFPQHYKALYRLAHYHFYYKKDKNVERCKDLMLGSFLGRNNSRMQGLFCERKNSNFFNGIWRIPAGEVDRPGSFASHMSRCVLITMEVLKEIDDHKMLLDLSLQLQKTPEADKKYLRDAERTELSQQALSLCVRSMKGILSKYNMKINSLAPDEKQTISNFMLDVYKSYQKVQKIVPTKVQLFSSILTDCFKLLSGGIYSESANLVDLSVKHCQSLISAMKQQANVSTSSSNSMQSVSITPVAQSKKVVKIIEQSKPASMPSTPTSSTFLPTLDLKQSFVKNAYAQNMANPFMPYLPTMDPLLSALSSFDRAAAAFSLVSNMGSLANLSNPAANNTLRAEFLQQLMSTSLASTFAQMKPTYNQATTITKTKSVDSGKNQKSSHIAGVKRQLSAGSSHTTAAKMKPNIQRNANYFPNFNNLPNPVLPKKTVPSELPKVNTVITNSVATNIVNPQNMFNITPGNVQVKPAHLLTATPTASVGNGIAKPAHMTTTCTVSAALHTKPPLPHQQISPGKTLQEKLAERQKQNPNITKTGPVGNKPTSPRSIACAAFSGKIPASLTITKSSINNKGTSTIVGVEQKITSDESVVKKREVKKTMRFEQPEKNVKSKNVVDTSEIIILDDD